MNPRGDVEFDLDLAGAEDAGRARSRAGGTGGGGPEPSRLAPVLGWGTVAVVLAVVGVAFLPTPPDSVDHLVADLSRRPDLVWESVARDATSADAFLAPDAVVTWGPGGVAAYELDTGAERWRLEEHVESCGVGAREVVACLVGAGLGSQDREVLTVDVATGETQRRDGEHVVVVDTVPGRVVRTVELRMDRIGSATVESRGLVGEPEWSVVVPSPGTSPASMSTAGGLVVVSGEAALALDADDGTWLDPAHLQTANGGTVWAASRPGGPVLVHGMDGSALGQLPRGALLPALDGAPGRAPHFLIDADGTVVTDEYGTVLWRTDEALEQVISVGGVVLLVRPGGGVDARDARDGRELWTREPVSGWSPRWTDGRLLGATTPSRHGSRLVVIDPRSGAERWSLDLDGGWVVDISPAGYVLVEHVDSFTVWRLPSGWSA
ncbi:hypothetical protein Bcav_1754 [Beutenbergia cavernae DSM 12333]|uniref:Pyrrolo-quinoline quinone repeat domain-containing protein n=1 Tax=Beutenbergia cavernae (strain ATCC BAA-8 / DSM 12333 / CCUG 43141 / JCM 11478 / NBRC 16432 / NCIMB 13614 / HKI 0122) TaxID=471853 RepID=C5C497_BEUC1|nr:PQQ-binding-like beta-propeller repeat protein [Beutenbergia cavernae]ACQ80010.1 hypothetical protein Bcav_1754 [Beutenbergia cavernae DSM 12333]